MWPAMIRTLPAPSTRMAWTDSDGTYAITGLPAGSYTASASLENYSFSVTGFTRPETVYSCDAGACLI